MLYSLTPGHSHRAKEPTESLISLASTYLCKSGAHHHENQKS